MPDRGRKKREKVISSYTLVKQAIRVRITKRETWFRERKKKIWSTSGLLKVGVRDRIRERDLV